MVLGHAAFRSDVAATGQFARSDATRPLILDAGLASHPEQNLAELRQHMIIHDNLIAVLSTSLSRGPEVSGMREQYEQLLRARARTRSAIVRLNDALNAERVFRLRAACTPPESARLRCRLVATRSNSNARTSGRARRVARVVRAALATGDPDAEPSILATRCFGGGWLTTAQLGVEL